MSEKTKACGECSRGEPVEKFCSDCITFLCQPCTDHHQHSKRFQSHRMISLTELEVRYDVPIQSKYPMCGEHDYELKHYCETCDQLVCLYCTVKEHNGHNHDMLKKMVRKRKQDNAIDAHNDSDLMKKKIRIVTTEGNNDDKLCNESSQNLQQQVEQLRSGIEQVKAESEQQKRQTAEQIDQLKSEVDQLKLQLVRTVSINN